MNKELSILKWVGIALACLTTIFTLVIVGSHLSGRLVGLGKVGIIGTVGAELMCIICAWLATSDRKPVAGTAMLSQIVLTAVLLINASIAMKLSWQEVQIDKANERQLALQKAAAEEQRKTIEAQTAANAQLLQTQAEAAGQLAKTDKRLARDFMRVNKPATNTIPPTVGQPGKPVEHAEAETEPLDIRTLSIYEQYGLTIAPLFLGLLAAVMLGLSAHVGERPTFMPPRPRSGFAPPQTTSTVTADTDQGKEPRR